MATHVAQRLWRTAFFTSLTTYGVFLLLDNARPGFVANVFSVHWLLLLTVVCGGAWLHAGAKAGRGKKRAVFLAVLIGLVLAATVWHYGQVFADARLLLAVAAAVLPLLGYLAT